MQVRIPYKQNKNLSIDNVEIGDILVQGNLTVDIDSQQDLSNYTTYNITSINDNQFGNTPHVHLGGQ